MEETTSYLDEENVFEVSEPIKPKIEVTATPSASAEISENVDDFHQLSGKVEELDTRVSTVETHVATSGKKLAEEKKHTRTKSLESDITKFM